MTELNRILIVEDSDDDFEAAEMALSGDPSFRHSLNRCETGDDALDYLFGTGAFADPRPERPTLVLLDLNLPGTSGKDVLRSIKSDPGLADIPVIIMTNSDADDDIDRCYVDGANSYVVKPIDIRGFHAALDRLRGQWSEIQEG